MDVPRLLFVILVVFLCFLTAHSYLVLEEPKDDKTLSSNSSMNLLDLPPVSMVAMKKKFKKKIKAIKKIFAKNKNAMKNSKPTMFPDPHSPTLLQNCVATRDICKPATQICCDPCAICKCRFFGTFCTCYLVNADC